MEGLGEVAATALGGDKGVPAHGGETLGGKYLPSSSWTYQVCHLG